MKQYFFLLLTLTTMASTFLSGAEEPQLKFHPAMRHAVLSKDSRVVEPAHFVDPNKGDDSGEGSKEQPWRTIQASLEKLKPGDTLYLREGRYFENVHCSIVGTPEAPITISGYPGEKAILDGSLPEFQLDPESSWIPGEAPGEFISTRTWRNIRDVLGVFENSHIGLQTYWYREDLIAENELRAGNEENALEIFTYCGPGIFYHKLTGRIHARLAHTKEDRPPLEPYRGPTDPRAVALVVAPFRSVPLFIDQGMHLRFRDLVIRGGGYNSVKLDYAVDLEFEYVTIFGGTYCLRAKSSGPVKMTHCGIYGQIPPWSYMSDNALHTPDPVHYSPFTSGPETKRRNIARLPSHALLVTEGGEESDTFYYPFNNRWEISYCEFADGHDGVYLNGRNMWIHHCWIDNMQDDATYISSPTPGVCDDVHFSRNYISKAKTPIGAHTRGGPGGEIYVYGNVIDMRFLLADYRPSTDMPEGRIISGASLFSPHGVKLTGIENITFAYNTALIPSIRSGYAGRTYLSLTSDTFRTSVNSIYVYFGGLDGVGPDSRPPLGASLIDGNLHWSAEVTDAEGVAWLEIIRNSVKSKENVEKFNGLPWDGRGIFADPRFLSADLGAKDDLDLHLKPGSAAAKLAVEFSKADALRDFSIGPASGAFQEGESQLAVGINGRVQAGVRPKSPLQP